MLDVLHHLSDAESFFYEAQRCLLKSGRIIMIEPFISLFSKLIYKYLHHENFDDKQKDWKLNGKDYLSNCNLALPTIIFFRDRKLFMDKFPKIELVSAIPYTIFLYHISGGLSLKSFVPDFMFIPLCKIEKLLFPLSKFLASMFIIELKKR